MSGLFVAPQFVLLYQADPDALDPWQPAGDAAQIIARVRVAAGTIVTGDALVIDASVYRTAFPADGDQTLDVRFSPDPNASVAGAATAMYRLTLAPAPSTQRWSAGARACVYSGTVWRGAGSRAADTFGDSTAPVNSISTNWNTRDWELQIVAHYAGTDPQNFFVRSMSIYQRRGARLP